MATATKLVTIIYISGQARLTDVRSEIKSDAIRQWAKTATTVPNTKLEIACSRLEVNFKDSEWKRRFGLCRCTV